MDYFGLAELVSYEPLTGDFHWKVDAGKVKAGGRAGTVSPRGYHVISYKLTKYQAHRLAWVIMTGDLPTDLIDHINCDKADNRWVNLREATRSQNRANARVLSDREWPKGVTFVRGQFRASIVCDGKSYYLGTHPSSDAAHAAYMAAARNFFGDFARAS